MGRKILSWHGLTVFTVFLLATFWEFYLEDFFPGGEPESIADRWEFVLTSCIFVVMGLAVSSIISFQFLKKMQFAERELMEGLDMFQQILHNAHDAIVTVDGEGVVTMWNQQAEQLFGWSAEEAAGKNVSDLVIPPDHREAHKAGLKRYILTGKGSFLRTNLELQARHKNGKEFPIELTISANNFENHHVFTGIIRDITERKEIEERLKILSIRDGLTGVGNRRFFDEVMQKEWKLGLRNQKPLSLILLDIDYFKNYNDAYGHPAGDRCLKEIADVIVSSLHRPADHVARYGGEEFVILMPDTDAKGVLSIGENIRANIETRKVEHSQSKVSAYVTASLGCATIIPSPDPSPADFLKTADRALYQAKKQNRNQVVFLSP